MEPRVDSEWAGIEVEYPVKLPLSFILINIDLDKDTEDQTDNVQPI